MRRACRAWTPTQGVGSKTREPLSTVSVMNEVPEIVGRTPEKTLTERVDKGSRKKKGGPGGGIAPSGIARHSSRGRRASVHRSRPPREVVPGGSLPRPDASHPDPPPLLSRFLVESEDALVCAP